MPNAASKLEPHRQFIATERKRGTTYRRIAELLAEKGVAVDYSTIHAFVKVRSKPRRAVISMLEAGAENASATDVSATKNASEQTGTPRTATQKQAAIERLKNAIPDRRQRPKGLASFQPDTPLERYGADEAKRRRDGL